MILFYYILIGTHIARASYDSLGRDVKVPAPYHVPLLMYSLEYTPKKKDPR